MTNETKSSDPVEWTPADASPAAPGDGWTTAGWALLVCGGAALIFAVMMNTSVETFTPGPYGGRSDVVNLDLQFTKGLAIAGCLFSMGAGIFSLGVGAIVKAIDRNR